MVCVVSGMWGSVVCEDICYMGKWHGKSTVCWICGMFEVSGIIDASSM